MYKIKNEDGSQTVFYKSFYKAGSGENHFDAMSALDGFGLLLDNFKYGVESVALATKSEIKKLEKE